MINRKRAHGDKVWVERKASGEVYFLESSVSTKHKGDTAGCNTNISQPFWVYKDFR